MTSGLELVELVAEGSPQRRLLLGLGGGTAPDDRHGDDQSLPQVGAQVTGEKPRVEKRGRGGPTWRCAPTIQRQLFPSKGESTAVAKAVYARCESQILVRSTRRA
jgi:hypothetical protein